MIGNDIVDLKLAKAQSNWQRPHFLEKIFTIHEQEFIRKSENVELEIWKLWTMKEAAYKIFNRETKIRGFFPWRLECSIAEFLDGKFLGSVSIDDQIYFTKTIQNEDYVYTIAANSPSLLDEIIEINSNEKIIKIDGLPFTAIGKVLVSITHHGRFERRISLGADC